MTEDAKGRAGTGEAAKGRQNAHEKPVKRLEKVVLHCIDKENTDRITITYYVEPGTNLFDSLEDGHKIIKAGKEYRLEGSIHRLTEGPADIEGHIIVFMPVPDEYQKEIKCKNYLFTAVVDAETKEAYNSKAPGEFYALLDDYLSFFEAGPGDPIKFTMQENERPTAEIEYLKRKYKYKKGF